MRRLSSKKLRSLDGIVLKNIDYSDDHKIITLFTREQGKLGCIARNTRKIRNSLKAAIEPGVAAEFSLDFSHRLPELINAEASPLHTRARRQIYMDPILLAYAAYWLELCSKILPDHEKHEDIYEQILFGLGLPPDFSPAPFTLSLELALLDRAGYKPTLNQCIVCGRKREGDTKHQFKSFSIESGGILCSQCQPILNSISYPPEIFDHFVQLQINNYLAINKIKIDKEAMQSLDSLISLFIQSHVQTRFKSKDVLLQIQKKMFLV